MLQAEKETRCPLCRIKMTLINESDDSKEYQCLLCHVTRKNIISTGICTMTHVPTKDKKLASPHTMNIKDKDAIRELRSHLKQSENSILVTVNQKQAKKIISGEVNRTTLRTYPTAWNKIKKDEHTDFVYWYNTDTKKVEGRSLVLRTNTIDRFDITHVYYGVFHEYELEVPEEKMKNLRWRWRFVATLDKVPKKKKES